MFDRKIDSMGKWISKIGCLLGLGCVLTSCETSTRLLKAKAVPMSPLIENPSELKENRKRAPFNRMWVQTNPRVLAREKKLDGIYIAPVSLNHLREVKQAIVKREIESGVVSRDEAEVAKRLRSAFIHAIEHSPRPRYLIRKKPDVSSVTLELAIVELNPTSPTGNVVKTGLKMVVGPLAGLGGIFTKGNIAIEGRLKNSQTGDLLFQFTDNEADRMTFYTLKDYRPYGHTDDAIQHWAEQFELFIRTPQNYQVKDSALFTLDPL